MLGFEKQKTPKVPLETLTHRASLAATLRHGFNGRHRSLTHSRSEM